MRVRGLVLSLLLAGAAPAAAQLPLLDVDIRAGLNSTSFSEDDSNANWNYFIGGDVRFGSAFFIQPGLYWQKQGFTLEQPGDDADIGVSSIMIPVQVGLALPLPIVSVEAGLGPTIAFNTSTDGLVDDDAFNGTRFGALLSAKLRVLMISGWIGYQWDFTDTFKEGDGSMSQWMFGVGFNF
jgi:hypothetical protein